MPKPDAADKQAPPSADANGILVGAWSHPVIPDEYEGFRATNCSLEACCPCFPLAQLEVRMGLTSYVCALWWYAATFLAFGVGLAALWIFVALWITSQDYRDRTSVLTRILWLLGMLLLVSVQVLLIVQRIASLRAKVRERFDIPGSIREDRTAVWQETARAIRQMRRHLQCDRAPCCGSVATLPAYVLTQEYIHAAIRVVKRYFATKTLFSSFEETFRMSQRRPRRLDGVLPTALELVALRREALQRLHAIDQLLVDDFEAPDEANIVTSSAKTRKTCPKPQVQDSSRAFRTRGLSFGSGRAPSKPSHYWVQRVSMSPGPGSYAVSTADALTKPRLGGGGGLGPRSGVCCRFQPCDCKISSNEVVATAMESFNTEDSGLRQETTQARRSSPPLVAYPRVPTKSDDFQILEQQKRVAAVQQAKQRWKLSGFNTTPHYCWTERRVGQGGVVSMNRSSSRDGKSAAKTRLRKLQIAHRQTQQGEAGARRATTAAATAKESSGSSVDMRRLAGRDAVRCKRKGQRVVTCFSG
ncbi:hypothetical protein BBJ28_00020239 [Nothophytophthora sp. Chile5]|nr:hypothetical protein BBJ28_00020239 [Nothophytophthora sp. Chile5]